MVSLPVATSKSHAGQPQILLSFAPMIIAANRSEVVLWVKKLFWDVALFCGGLLL
jgi:hypothetical protein